LIASAKSNAPSSRSSPRALSSPLTVTSPSSWTPMTPVEQTATPLGRRAAAHRRGALHACGLVEAGPAGRRVGVAELRRHDAQRLEVERSFVTCTGADEDARAGELRRAGGVGGGRRR
jgi:hypothetical protein